MADVARHLRDYDSAVITGVDAEGYPFSIRCTPRPDPAAPLLRVQVPEHSGIQPGPASLLCHKHDDQLWNQRSFAVRGTLSKDAAGWTFHPQHFIPGAAGDLWSLINFVRGARRAAKRYLAQRGLRRPKIPWKQIQVLWAEVKAKH